MHRVKRSGLPATTDLEMEPTQLMRWPLTVQVMFTSREPASVRHSLTLIMPRSSTPRQANNNGLPATTVRETATTARQPLLSMHQATPMLPDRVQIRIPITNTTSRSSTIRPGKNDGLHPTVDHTMELTYPWPSPLTTRAMFMSRAPVLDPLLPMIMPPLSTTHPDKKNGLRATTVQGIVETAPLASSLMPQAMST